jgi:hypothetical protein
MIFKPSGIFHPLIEKVLWHKTTIGHIWRKLLVIGNNTSKRKI